MPVAAMDQYHDAEGFIDVSALTSKKMAAECFPGLLDEVDTIRQRDFPLFDRVRRIYLDSTATSQQPQSVKDRMHEYRRSTMRGSNHSKNSAEAREAQERFEEAREKLRRFFNAQDYVITFTSGTTESSNWIAMRFRFKKGDVLIIPIMEHHSQMLTAKHYAKQAGAEVKFLAVTKEEGRLDLSALEKMVRQKKGQGRIIITLSHISNVTGVIAPVAKVREIIGDSGLIYLDIAQSAGHMPIDLDALAVDFAGVSAHKMYGPMGIGAMFIRKSSEKYLHDHISGGSAVALVSRHTVAQAKAPARFEPGTQDIEGAIEWGFTLDYLNEIGMDKIASHDSALGTYFFDEIRKIPGITVLGPQTFSDKAAVITFVVGPEKPRMHLPLHMTRNYDKIAKSLDEYGISVRDGCFCAHQYIANLLELQSSLNTMRTLMMKAGITEEMFKLPGAVRVSFAFYNTLAEAYKTVQAIREIRKKG